MPRRLQSTTRLWVYRCLVIRDGEECSNCHKKPSPAVSAASYPPKKRVVLEIDHIDGNKHNWSPSNLQLLCKSCNVTKENQARGERRKRPSAVNERERLEGLPGTRIAREFISFAEDAPATMQANALYELSFRAWILGQLEASEAIDKKEAVRSGAEVAGCSPTTTARYLEKLVSAVGPLEEVIDSLGVTLVRFKQGRGGRS